MNATTDADTDLADKILHILTIYPIVSPTMLQAGLGPSIKSSVWRPVLQQLIAKEKVVQETHAGNTHTGRFNSYTLLKLPETTVDIKG